MLASKLRPLVCMQTNGVLFLALTAPGDEACFENMPSDDS